MNKFQESLKKYIDLYKDQETYFANDKRNLEYFKAYPANTKREDILQKLSLMDDAAFHKLNALKDMTDHILRLNIDPKLARRDLSVVEEIALITLNGKKENLLHLASAYCNLHQPDVYPVYSDQYIDFYKSYIRENKLPLNPDELGRYSVFSRALEDLITRHGIKGKLNYLQMRKFAWIYAEKVIEESR